MNARAARRFIAYYHVSTDRQDRSGLGLEAQQKAVRDYLNRGAWELVDELVEIESGKQADRPPILGPEASAALRDRLIAELKAIASSQDATTWAHRISRAKNSLIAADARQVEDTFQAGQASFGTGDAPLSPVLSALSRATISRIHREDFRCQRHRQEPVGPSRAAPLS